MKKKKVSNNEMELKMIQQLSEENSRLKKAGGFLAQRAIYTVTEFDGLHRLSLAVARWATVVANEGGRSKKEKNEN